LQGRETNPRRSAYETDLNTHSPLQLKLGSGRWNRTSYLSPIKQVPILMCLTRTEKLVDRGGFAPPIPRCKRGVFLTIPTAHRNLVPGK